MASKLLKSYPRMAVVVFFCIVVVQTRGQSYNSCPLLQVNKHLPSLPIHLKNNQDTFLMFNHIVDEASQTKILNDGGGCLVGLKHFSYEEMDCQLQFYTEEENSTLVFNQREDSLIVFKKSENDVKFNIELKELRFTTNNKIDVALDCVNSCEWISVDGGNPGNLLLLDNHDTYVRIFFVNKDSNLWIRNRDEIHDCLMFISRRARVRNTSKCTVHFRSDGDETRLVLRNHNGSLTIRKLETVYNLIGNSDTLKITSDTPVNVSSKCSESDVPHDEDDSDDTDDPSDDDDDDVTSEGMSGYESFLEGLSEIHVYAVAAVCGALILVIITLCFYIVYLKMKQSHNKYKEEEKISPGFSNSKMEEPPPIEEPIYETISMGDLQERLGTSDHNPSSDKVRPFDVSRNINTNFNTKNPYDYERFDEELETKTPKEEDATSFKSHVSINSIYGEI